jgi:hypothetical protein
MSILQKSSSKMDMNQLQRMQKTKAAKVDNIPPNPWLGDTVPLRGWPKKRTDLATTLRGFR